MISEFEFEVDENISGLLEERKKESIYLHRKRFHEFGLGSGSPIESEYMRFGNKRVAERIIFQKEFEERWVEDLVFRDTESFTERASGAVTDDAFDREHG